LLAELLLVTLTKKRSEIIWRCRNPYIIKHSRINGILHTYCFKTFWCFRPEHVYAFGLVDGTG